jgi:hypothetical protein
MHNQIVIDGKELRDWRSVDIHYDAEAPIATVTVEFYAEVNMSSLVFVEGPRKGGRK